MRRRQCVFRADGLGLRAQYIAGQSIIVARNLQVCSRQHGLHIVEQVPEEGPMRQHLTHHVSAVPLERR